MCSPDVEVSEELALPHKELHRVVPSSLALQASVPFKPRVHFESQRVNGCLLNSWEVTSHQKSCHLELWAILGCRIIFLERGSVSGWPTGILAYGQRYRACGPFFHAAGSCLSRRNWIRIDKLVDLKSSVFDVSFLKQMFISRIWLESSRKVKLTSCVFANCSINLRKGVRVETSGRFCHSLLIDRALPSLKGILWDLHCLILGEQG